MDLSDNQSIDVLLFNLALPDYDHFPSKTFEALDILLISILILFKLRLPIGQIAFRQPARFASRALMPETTMYENNCLETRKDNIRLSRKIFSMETETQAMGM